MNKQKVTLAEAVKFHGHLGPYLVLGLLAGEMALEKLRCRKYFGLQVKVWGAEKKPKSCLIDGLQLSTGSTYGKGNIEKLNSQAIKIEIYHCLGKKKIILTFKEDLKKKLQGLKSHKKSGLLAKELYQTNPANLFNLKSNN